MTLNKYNAFFILGAVAFFSGIIYVDAKINNPVIAESILNEKGFSDVTITGNNWWCAKGTPIKKDFTAKDINGNEVEGAMCANNWLVPDRIRTKPRSNKKYLVF